LVSPRPDPNGLRRVIRHPDAGLKSKMADFLKRARRYLRKRRFVAIWIAGMIAAGASIVAAFSPYSPLDRLSDLVFDAYQNLQPRPAAESPVVVVDIDDESIRRFGQWPWPRTFLADLIERLNGMGAATIGLDLLLSEPDRTSPALALAQLRDQGFQITSPPTNPPLDHDEVLAGAFGRAPVVSGLALAQTVKTPPPEPKAGISFGGADPLSYLQSYAGSVRNLTALDEAASGIGVISFPPARDGVVREIPLLSRYDTKLYPSLSIETLRVAQGASAFLVRSTGAHGEADTGLPGMVAVKVGNFEVPTGASGKMRVYYSSEPAAAVLPVHRIMSADQDPQVADTVAGRIVLIGTSAIGLRDLVSTPLTSALPGVLVHAEIIEQIVGGTFLSRPDWAIGAEVSLAIVLSIVVLAFLPWLPSGMNALVAANALAVSIAGGWLAFGWYKLLLSPILPVQCTLLAYGIGSGVRLLLSERERRYIRGAFSHYLAPSMVQQLMDNPQALNLGGENRELTLLFCDVRGFTGISEGLGPSELTQFLNDFLTPMTDVLMNNGATIDKYMGDAIMAFWNAPLAVPEHRRQACRSVLQMQEALAELNRNFSRPVSIGIGLSTGICCVGNLGSRQRFDYSAIGDPVNVASRVEGLTKQYGLTSLVAQSTAEGCDDLALLEVDRVRLLGRGAATSVFTVLGDAGYAAGEAFRTLRDTQAEFLASYRRFDIEAAGSKLKVLEKIAPPELGKTYAIFRRRIESLKGAPMPAGWDGTFLAEQK
jgi:adenylate cyclase